MGHSMATAAGVEFFQHFFGMGTAVTFNTSFDGLMLFGMTFDTEQGSMFCIALFQHLFGLAMTVAADGIWCVIRICDFERLVRGVAG